MLLSPHVSCQKKEEKILVLKQIIKFYALSIWRNFVEDLFQEYVSIDRFYNECTMYKLHHKMMRKLEMLVRSCNHLIRYELAYRLKLIIFKSLEESEKSLPWFKNTFRSMHFSANDFFQFLFLAITPTCFTDLSRPRKNLNRIFVQGHKNIWTF